MINGLLLVTCAVKVSAELWLFLTDSELPAELKRANTKSSKSPTPQQGAKIDGLLAIW